MGQGWNKDGAEMSWDQNKVGKGMEQGWDKGLSHEWDSDGP